MIKFNREGVVLGTVSFCDRNLNLLAHAQSIELEVGSECGGHGICGQDRVRFSPGDLAKLSPVTDEERAHLTKTQLANGWRLSCQCFPEKSGEALDVEVAPVRRVLKK